MSRHSSLRRFCCLLLLCLAFASLASEASAQRKSKTPEPETQKLTTKDGVELSVTYYASTLGKKAAPVILVHDEKGSRHDFKRLATRLQKPEPGDEHKSFAVVTVDLRGHGDSRRQNKRGREIELDAAKLSVQDVSGMVLGDLESVRKLLVKENDDGKLNLNRLGMVGIGMGAVVATNFAARDWAVPKLASVKQGQDVKAIVMISPEWKIKGLGMQQALRQSGVQRNVATMIHYGNENRGMKRTVDRVYGQLDRYHDDAVESGPAEVLKSKDPMASLLTVGYKTKLQGAELLKRGGDRVDRMIAKFLQQHTEDDDYDYSKRVSQ